MARPRVFVSSTFYDLKQVRTDLELFIRDLGYEPVLNERGNIPYGGDQKLEENCYREIELTDILVSIIGGRYGSGSQVEANRSISQMELRTAVELGRQVFIFVERSVLAEYQTYLANKEIEGVRYRHVDDPRVYKFLEEIESLPQNNAMSPFESAQDIIRYLKEQWAGLFQRYLRNQSRVEEVRMVENIKATADTLSNLVAFLNDEHKKGRTVTRHILLAYHPALQQMRTLIEPGFPLFFTNRDEMEALLQALGYTVESYDEDASENWIRTEGYNRWELKIAPHLFDEYGRLILYTAADWREDWIKYNQLQSEDEIPF